MAKGFLTVRNMKTMLLLMMRQGSQGFPYGEKNDEYEENDIDINEIRMAKCFLTMKQMTNMKTMILLMMR